MNRRALIALGAVALLAACATVFPGLCRPGDTSARCLDIAQDLGPPVFKF